MSAIFNQALRQSTALRNDLDAFQSAVTTGTPSPALQGQITTSLTSFSRTLDTYAKQITNELVPEKKTRDEERLANYRTELLDYKSRFATLKHEAEEAKAATARSELLGRRPHAANHTPENPYSDANVASTARSAGDGNKLFRVNNPNFQHSEANPYSSYSSPYALNAGEGGDAREQHAYREQSFFSNTNATLDEYIERGRAVLGDLGDQREMLKGTQRKLYSVANTLGISGDTIRMVERRAKQDKWIFWTGVVIFVVFIYLVLKYLR
ncbi:hypothetical protein BDZ85DRAFT_88077 [Elsinoe ampelina]|uniref:Protein transport protein BOS1 n=1 Tax=Elsinoe ampelina TaxID=302913 RepID=A0A6A6GHB9_9PEZI|nr:hypothetical protein BDZ85DRAFT_88077 [Elsinoe ampelina]